MDVTNYAALELYRRAGYERVLEDDLMYYEFTKSLNLHDGATKGRNHFLMQKHLLEPTWLPKEDARFFVNTGTLGFEITA